VNLKLSKGYRFFKREPEKPIIMDIEPRQISRETSRNTTAWSINIIPPSSNQSGGNGLKRREEESLVREDLKQTKYERNEWEDRSDRNDRNGAIEEENPYPLPQMTGDKDLDEAIALSILEEARKKKLGKRGGDHSNGFSDTRSNRFGGASASNHVSNDDGFSASIVSASFQTFKGEYLSRGTQFFKIQVLRKHIKIEKGDENGKKEKEFKICLDGNDAIAQAKTQISELESKGYQSKTYKFTFDFNDNELNFERKSHHMMPKSAPVSRGGSPNDSRNDLNVGDDDDEDNFNRLGIDNDDYSNTSRRSSKWDLSEDEKANGRSRPRSASFSRADNNQNDDDDEDDEDYDGGAAVDLGPDPLGKPVSKFYSSVLLAHKWENEDPTGWYMSEKLDGVRCFWNGKTMWSRNGKQYFPPKFFVKDFPKSPLDGELWTGRSTFQKCVSYVRKQTPLDHEWRNVKYMVFDAPELKMTFKDRYKKMKEVFGKIKCPYIELLDHRICKGRSDLNDELAVVQNVGGEGLMIRNPNSFYENKRSRTLLKVKTFDDDEATIIGHEPGSGKYLNMTGALRVRNGAGVEFSVGSGLNDAMRARPPKIGVKITYKHQGVSNRGVPRFPTFLRIYQGD